ncbi:hypothetical protein DESPIG_02267 [Desulfovibrio piger ATCC 29098]|uniref:Uncharacterized protein n=1 Tax=Desulfovibrio piger ATCC 29098 TaxID=411464 RepID=B6WVZ9_9BACT|nr:hypothetical protein DESPIG_02267 [Desulfovibrio piger ATCC 29098]
MELARYGRYPGRIASVKRGCQCPAGEKDEKGRRVPGRRERACPGPAKEATGRRSARDGGNGEQASRTTVILSLGQIRGKGNGQRRVFGASGGGGSGTPPDGAAGKVEASEKGKSG